MKYVSLNCAECGKEFQKPKNEYNRRLKEGAIRFFCSNSCSGKLGNRENPPSGNPDSLRGYADNRRDELTPFKWFMRNVRRRAKHLKYDSDITLEYLKELFESQNGICPFTGWKLFLPFNSDVWTEDTIDIKCASLDRIDNNIGYLKGNVRFIAVIANYARNTFTDEEVIEFANAVTEYRK